MENVKPSLSEVGVFGCMVDSMVVVPQGSGILAVGVVVVLILPRLSSVLCPSIERSSAVRPVQVNRIRPISVVDESYNSFASLRHFEGRAWGDTVVSDESGFPKIRVDLLEERLDFDLIVVDRKSSRRTRECPSP